MTPNFLHPKVRYPNSWISERCNDSVVLYCPKKGKFVTLLSIMHSMQIVDTNSEKKKPVKSFCRTTRLKRELIPWIKRYAVVGSYELGGVWHASSIIQGLSDVCLVHVLS